jgi:hypothetical protein
MSDNFKPVPSFEDKFEINEKGVVRNIKTKRETQPYHTSQKTGPMVHLLDTKSGRELRQSTLRLVFDTFGTNVSGWDNVDVQKIDYKTVVKKPRKADGASKKAPKTGKKAPKSPAKKAPAKKKVAAKKAPAKKAKK